MSESTRVLILFILIALLLLAMSFVWSNYLMRRALKKVIKMLRDGYALTPATAKTAEELGFKSKSMFQLRFRRDYKPAALNLLITSDIIQTTEDGRIFLSEENYSKSRLAQQR